MIRIRAAAACALLTFGLGISACATVMQGSGEPAQIFQIATTPIPLSSSDNHETRVGDLLYRGGVELQANDPRFGGWSGLAISTDGKRLLSQSDDAHWLRAEPVYDKNGDLSDVNRAEMADMNGLDGKPMIGKEGDAEGLATISPAGPDGPVLVSFERNDRVWRYDLSHTLDAMPEPVAMPDAIHKLRMNSGLESIVLLQPHTLLAIAEDTRDANRDMIAWLVPYEGRDTGVRYGALGIVVHAPYEISDAAMSPDGKDLYLLERHYFGPILGVVIAVRRVDVSSITAGSRVDGREIAKFTLHENIDNMEGIALRKSSEGKLLLYMISDDNYDHLLQRTLLLMFEVSDRSVQ